MPPKDSAPPRDKILFVDLGSHFGGVEVYIEGLAEILGQNCEMHAVSSLGKLTGNLRRKKVRVYSFTRIGSKWLKPLRLALAMVFVPWLVFHYQIRTVQVNGYFESALLLPLRLLRRKTIYTMHGPFETDRYAWYRNPARYFPRVMSKYCLQFASVVVCVSGAVAQVARGALPPHKLIVIPNWVHLPPLPAVKTKPAHIVQLLYVGRLEQYKGVHLIIQAMRELIDAELHIVGEGTYRAELEKLSIGVPIQFHGFQSDPSRFYSNADIFINPSLGPEGLPIVSLEAMSYGLACIMSDLPVHREITGDGCAAALFSRGNARELRLLLHNMIQSRALRSSFSSAAREAVERKYSHEIASAKYRTLFRTVTGQL